MWVWCSCKWKISIQHSGISEALPRWYWWVAFVFAVMPSIKPQAGIIGPKKRVLEFYDIIIEELEGQGRTGYADVFKANKGIISNHLFHYNKIKTHPPYIHPFFKDIPLTKRHWYSIRKSIPLIRIAQENNIWPIPFHMLPTYKKVLCYNCMNPFMLKMRH